MVRFQLAYRRVIGDRVPEIHALERVIGGPKERADRYAGQALCIRVIGMPNTGNFGAEVGTSTAHFVDRVFKSRCVNQDVARTVAAWGQAIHVLPHEIRVGG